LILQRRKSTVLISYSPADDKTLRNLHQKPMVILFFAPRFCSSYGCSWAALFSTYACSSFFYYRL